MHKLFEYAVLYHDRLTKEQREAGDSPKAKLVLDVTRIIAKDEKIAAMQAARDIPDEYKDKLDQVEILVRPF